MWLRLWFGKSKKRRKKKNCKININVKTNKAMNEKLSRKTTAGKKYDNQGNVIHTTMSLGK